MEMQNMKGVIKFLIIFIFLLGGNIAEARVTHNTKTKDTIINPRLEMIYQLKNIKKEILNLKNNQIEKASHYALKAAAICVYFETYNKKLGLASKYFIKWKTSDGINNLKLLAKNYT